MPRPPVEPRAATPARGMATTRAELLAVILAASLIWLPLFGAGRSKPPLFDPLRSSAPIRSDRVADDPAEQQRVGGQPWSVALGDIRVTDALLVLIGLAQALLMRRQAAIARNQADIAERQIAMTNALERPLMLLSSFRWQVEGWQGQADKSSFPVMTVGLSNRGRGLAIVDHCCLGLVIGSTPPIRRFNAGFMAADTHDGDGNLRRVGYVKHFTFDRGMTPGSGEWLMETKQHPLTPAQVDELGTGHQRAWLDGEVRYRDSGGREYETQFRFLYDRDADILTPDDGAPDFNRHT